MPTIPHERLELMQVIGVSVVGGPPIGTVHLSLGPGLRVLYGKNGAGKTRLLKAIESGLRNEAPGDSTVWVHVVLDPQAFSAEALRPSEEFIEALRTSLWDSMSRKLRRGEWFSLPESIRRLVDLVDRADLTLADLIIASAWSTSLGALQDEDRVWQELSSDPLFLSVRVSANESAVHLSTQPLSTGPIEGSLLEMLLEGVIHLAGNGIERSKREARDAEGYWTVAMENESLPDGVIEWLDDRHFSTQDALLALRHLNPELSFLHKGRPSWVPVPLLPLTTIDRVPMWNWSGQTEVSTSSLSDLTIQVFDDAGIRLFESKVADGLPTLSTSETASADLAFLASEASNLYQNLFLDAPPLDLRLTPVTNWPTGPAVEWVALDTNSLEWVAIEDLSEAQRRWALIAIEHALADLLLTLPTPMIFDEPEQALHTTATRHLGTGLETLARKSKIPILVASHAPAMLGLAGAELLHVHRGDDGMVEVSAIPPDAKSDIDKAASRLGLIPSDLLQLTRLFLFVEGQHEITVLGELFGSRFDNAGIRLMPLGGSRRLAAITDSRFLFTYTDAEVLVLLDRVRGEQWSAVWTETKDLAAGGREAEAHGRLTKGLGRFQSAEEEQLSAFAHAAIDLGKADRLQLWGLSQPDIIYYLPADSFVQGESWSDLQASYLASRKTFGGEPEGIKRWLEREHDARISIPVLRRAAKALIEAPPDELSEFATHAINVAGGSSRHGHLSD